MIRTSQNIVAIHQPNFVPWLGYFYKIAQCDHFIFYDHAEFTKKSFIRRVAIHKHVDSGDDQLLIIPLKKHSDYAPINILEISNNFDWKKKITNQFHHVYRKSRNYKQANKILEIMVCSDIINLSQLNINLIRHITNLLEIETKFHLSSNMNLQSKANAANIEMCEILNASHYLSGQGAKKYQHPNKFNEKGIELIYSNLECLWQTSNIDEHYKNKSILSIIAEYGVDPLKTLLKSAQRTL